VELELTGETEVLKEIFSSATLFITNPTWSELDPNPGRRSGKPATNRLSYTMGFNTIIRKGKERKSSFCFVFVNGHMCKSVVIVRGISPLKTVNNVGL
jgi:hypothetical protein